MEEATIKLLQECSQGCQMAVESMDQVSKYVTGDRMGSLITDYRRKHEQLGKRVDGMLKESGAEPKQPGMAASAMSWMTTEVKMKLKNDNSQISTLMMDGCNMGIQSISRTMNENAAASKESRGLAQELVRTEEAFMQDLKEFL